MINTKDKSFRIGAGITGLMLLVILIGLLWTPYDPNAMTGAPGAMMGGRGGMMGDPDAMTGGPGMHERKSW